MKNYIAITIGPIYKTLSQAKKTRELWGASYLFSYIMELLLKSFKDRNFITPFIDEDLFDVKKPRSVGIFPDRAIFEAKENDSQKIRSCIEEVYAILAQSTPLSKEFVKNYFQIHAIEVALEESQNPIIAITPLLDSQELFYNVAQFDMAELKKFLKEDNRFLKKRAFADPKRQSFASLPEIALAELDIKPSQLKFDEEESIYEDKELKQQIKPYHKYIAIIYADGDKMGESIQKLKDNEFQTFSKALLDFAKESDEIIKKYGGALIYAGGDDLLFFAPVKSKEGDVFQLCKELRTLFDQKTKKIASTASLSFGISITYYKFPLYEALEKSASQLFGVAKSKRDSTAFVLIKHSGQTFGGLLEHKVYEHFLNLIALEAEENFLHSLHHKIAQHKPILKEILAKEDRKERLQNFFDNYFNEDEHTKYREFFKKIQDYIIMLHDCYKDTEDNTEEILKLLYASLRYKKFLLGDKDA